MRPDVTFTTDSKDPLQQVVTFTPPVATWSFAEGKTADQLWMQLRQATSALLFEHQNEPFTPKLQEELRARILSVLLVWASQRWLIFPES